MSDKIDSPRLRDFLGISPTGQRIHIWSGTDKEKDTASLIATIAATGKLFSRGGQFVRLGENGEPVLVNAADFRTFLDQNICTMRLVQQRDGKWQVDYPPFRFPPAWRRDVSLSGPQEEPPEIEPNDRILDEIYRHGLAPHLPKVEG